MLEDKMDKILEDVCRNDWQKIKGINDIEVPDFEQTMDRLKKSLHKQPVNPPLSRVQKWGKSLTAAACILVCSMLFSAIWDMPEVKALRFDIIRTIISFKDGITTIKQGSMNTADIPKGAIQPPPSDFEGDSSVPDGTLQSSTDMKANAPIEKTMTLEQAKKEIPFALLIPDYIPPGYRLKEVRSSQINLESYIIRQEYVDDSGGSITISQQSSVKSFGSGGGTRLKVKKIKVMGQDTVLVTNETDYCRAQWYKDEFLYSIEGNISEKEFMKLLESLKK